MRARISNNNNDVVKNHITNEYEYLLFCNNDIKLLNNVIYGMLKVFKSKSKQNSVDRRLNFTEFLKRNNREDRR